jgi:hypothetical protein
MGLLDGLLNAALGGSGASNLAPAGSGAAPGGAALTQILGGLLQQQGGIAGRVDAIAGRRAVSAAGQTRRPLTRRRAS